MSESRTIITTYGEDGAKLQSFLSTCELSLYDLYWNSGSGYLTTKCINARGNRAFYKSGPNTTNTTSATPDYYIGAGAPNETGISAKMAASQIVGRHVGKVSNDSSRTTTSDLAIDGTYVVATSATYTRYLRTVTSSDTSKGTVGANGASYWYDGSGNRVTSTITYVKSGSTTDSISAAAGIVFTSSPKSGYQLEGWYVGGVKVTATSSAENIYLSGSDGQTLNIKADYKADVEAEARFESKKVVYVRWNSPYSSSENGAVVDYDGDAAHGNGWRRIASGTSGTTLRTWSTTSSVKLMDITNSSPKQWLNSSVMYANYFPINTGGNYWVGRNQGAKLRDSVLLGWDLRNSQAGSVLGTLPADGSSTIADIYAIFDDNDIPNTGHNSDGDYWVAHLKSRWGSITSAAGGELGSETPWTTATTQIADGVVTATVEAQTESLDRIMFKRWGVVDGDGNPVQVEDATANPLTFALPASDVTATAVYAPKAVEITVSEDLDSVDAISGVTLTVWRDGSQVISGYQYGDEARFSATLAEGYGFGGWYDATTGSLVSAQNPLVVPSVTDDIRLKAKASASVTVKWGKLVGGAVVDDSDNHGTVSLGGQSYSTGVATKSVPLGETVTVGCAIEGDETGAFGGWWIHEGNAYTMLDIEQNGIYTVPGSADAQITLWALYQESAPKYYVAIYAKDEDDDEYAPALGDFALSGEGVEELEKSAWQTATGRTAASNGRFYEVTGVRKVSLSVFQRDAKKFSGITWNSYQQSGGMQMLDVEDEAPVAILSKVITEDCYAIVNFSNNTEATITVQLASDEASSMGRVDLSGAISREVNPSGWPVIGTYDRGTTATILAMPSIGYKFKEWRIGGNPVPNAGAQYSFEVEVSATYTAVFEADTVGICEWEGSSENKTLEWRSKVYTMPRPFDPVACRVDAAAYPVTLNVETTSKPDTMPVRDHERTLVHDLGIPLVGQDGRRLPRMRPERFLQVAVTSRHEVDAVVVGTNMAEVN